ncbi:hypothetical protein M8A51_09145 [Schlegelella sp. S2-27]|uniref:Uncharacterized protein n=1 Tax=Caldimonas mangrovi TaxID=2944811 RepID=A0ABT0YMW6_9BURK|nr:hypothetical protein [Caldimonas mangrovi]MCM5679699.1 hypothetical protein [Caldimonas mangrovi]
MNAKQLLSGVAAALMAAGVYAQSAPSPETGSQLGGGAGQGEVTPRSSDYGAGSTASDPAMSGSQSQTYESSMSDATNGVERKRDQALHPAGSTGSSFGGIAGDGEVSTFPEAEPTYQADSWANQDQAQDSMQ